MTLPQTDFPHRIPHNDDVPHEEARQCWCHPTLLDFRGWFYFQHWAHLPAEVAWLRHPDEDVRL